MEMLLSHAIFVCWKGGGKQKAWQNKQKEVNMDYVFGWWHCIDVGCFL
jgi:hypothetical protein